MGSVSDNLAITLDEAKNFLRVDNTADNALIQDCINAAKDDADAFLNNDFDEGETTFRGDGTTSVFDINTGPIYRVTKVYIDNIQQGASRYTIDATLGTITFGSGYAPAPGVRVRVEYEREPAIPTQVRTWVLRRAAHLYERRTLQVSTQNDGAGGVSWRDAPDWDDLWQLRKNPGF